MGGENGSVLTRVHYVVDVVFLIANSCLLAVNKLSLDKYSAYENSCQACWCFEVVGLKCE